MPRHVHIPQRIIIAPDLEYAGLAQCTCGQVALLVDWRAGSWPRRKERELAFSLLWELVEEWRGPDEEEQALLNSDEDLLADYLLPPAAFQL